MNAKERKKAEAQEAAWLKEQTVLPDLTQPHENPETLKRPPVGRFTYMVKTREEIMALGFPADMPFVFAKRCFESCPKINFLVRPNVTTTVPIFADDPSRGYAFCTAFGDTLENAIAHMEKRIKQHNEVGPDFKGTQTGALIHNPMSARGLVFDKEK